MKMLSTLFLVTFLAHAWCYPESGSLKQDQNCLICTEEYAPVCGINRDGEKKTFGNDCELDAWNCLHRNGENYRLISHGVCPEAVKDLKCDIVCTAQYDPICAENSKGIQKTFGNACNVSQHNCQNAEKFQVIHKGECTDKKD